MNNFKWQIQLIFALMIVFIGAIMQFNNYIDYDKIKNIFINIFNSIKGNPFFLIFISVVTILIIRHIMIVSSVKKHSRLFIKLREVNDKYHSVFDSLQKRQVLYYHCNSLQKFRNNDNRTSIMNYVCGCVREDELTWKELYDRTNKNKSILKSYLNEYSMMKDKYEGKSYGEIAIKPIFTENQYLKLEKKICEGKLLNPITSLEIIINISYTSPAGRNSYSSKWTFEDAEVDEIFTRIEDRKISEQSIDYQRALMTTGKRYDVLKRDKFACQLCGRTQADGAKLEIDHIIPVSKGGKTVDENLQTLCHECNQGKKAKV